MNIKTKYDIGQVLYYMDDPCFGDKGVHVSREEVLGINISAKYGVQYEFEDRGRVREENIFPTIDELLEVIRNEYEV